MEVFKGVKIETLKNDVWTNEVTCVLTLLKNSGNGGSVVIQGHDEEGELRFKTSVIHLRRARDTTQTIIAKFEGEYGNFRLNFMTREDSVKFMTKYQVLSA
jgi:hypothetical protein